MTQFDLQKLKETLVISDNHILAGLACLASVARYFGSNIPLSKLHQQSSSAHAISLLGLSNFAVSEGFQADGYKGNIEIIKSLDQPAILHIQKDSASQDYIVLYGWQNDKFITGDPKWGIVEYREDELDAIWKSKTYLVVKPGKNFRTASISIRERKDWLKKLLKDHSRAIIIIIFSGIVIAILSLILMQKIFNLAENILAGRNGSIEIKRFVQILIILLILKFINSIVNRFTRQAASVFLSTVYRKIAASLFRQGREATGTGEFHSFLTAGRTLTQGIFRLIFTVPLFIPLFIASLIFVSMVSLISGMVLILIALLTLISIPLFQKEYGLLILQRNQFEVLETATIKESLDSAKKAILISKEDIILNSLGTILSYSDDIRMKIKISEGRLNNWFRFIVSLAVIAVFTVNFYSNDPFDGIRVVSIAGWGIIGIFSLKELFNNYLMFIRSRVCFHFLYEGLENLKPFLTNADRDNDHKGSAKKDTTLNTIEIENLNIAFPGRLPVIRNASFYFETTKVTAIHGRTGSGKSTLVSVLCRLQPVSSGEIKADGKNWEFLSARQWRENISVLSQPIHLFNTTVLLNIGWGITNSTPDKIIEFCRESGLDKYFASLPGGYSANTGNISAGERQLVALANAIFKNPQILLLDEPFAGMDAEMEDACWNLLHKLKKDMIIVLLSSGNTAKSKADRIFTLKNKKEPKITA
jgi:ATP-binding cassette, subfamily C, bacteriocin exporter